MSIGALKTEADLKRFIEQQLRTPGVLPAPPASGSISGQVSAAGAVEYGAGFTSQKTGTGIYKISLLTELKGIGLIQVTPVIGSVALTLASGGKKDFEVHRRSTPEVLADGAFFFAIQVVPS